MTSSHSKKLSIFLLSMINVAAICSIKNWPLTAVYGYTSLFYFMIAITCFFIPVSLISAELATGFPERGGVYIWVTKAFGHRIGFLASWLQWISNVVWYPTILSFIAGSIAFAFNPTLQNHSIYMFFTILISFWGVTILNLYGMNLSGWLSSLGVIFGTILPGTMIIGLAIAWIISGYELQIAFSFQELIPTLSDPHQWSILSGVLLGFAGMEMSAVHAKDVLNPKRNYPKAILLSALLIIILSILGTLSIAIVIPKNMISFVGGGMEAIQIFLSAYGLTWATPLIAILIAFGAIGSVSTWAAGPSRGLLAAAQHGDFPPILHTINKKNVPIAMLIFQGIIVSIVSAIFLFVPDINSSFWILIVIASQLYLIMYILMFSAGIYLRYSYPNIERSYRIPGKNWGMWIIALIGIITAFGSIIVGFFPPREMTVLSTNKYVGILIIGILGLSVIPLIILKFKKPSWNQPIVFYDD